MSTKEQAAADQVAYAKNMIAGNHAECVRIEKQYDLYGYPPGLVSVGLAAVAEGRDAHGAIEKYSCGMMP